MTSALLALDRLSRESPADPLTIHLSRNEAETAAKFDDWFLVVCLVEGIDPPAGRILGWAGADRIDHRPPTDARGGRWEQAACAVPLHELTPGLRRAVSYENP